MIKNILKIKLFLFYIFIFFILSSINPLVVKAQAYRGLIIDQYSFDIPLLNPGDSIEKTFKVTHDYQDENKKVTLFLRSKDFTQGDQPGIPLFLEKNQVPLNSRLSDWITFEQESITLDKRGDSAEVKFTINVPVDAEPGGKYAAALLSNNSGEEAAQNLNGSGFGLNSELGPLIFVTVGGDILKDLQIKDIYTTNIEDKRTDFFFNPPVNIIVEFENTGNVHIAPVGRIYIHKGDDFTKYYETYELNPNNNYILPGTTRKFIYTWNDSFISTEKTSAGNLNKDGTEEFNYSTSYDWDKLSKLRLGKYNVSVQFAYKRADGTNANPPVMKSSFTIIPWQLILFASATTILLILFISLRFLKRKKSKKVYYDKKFQF